MGIEVGALSIQSKIPEFRLQIKWTISVGSDQNIWDYL